MTKMEALEKNHAWNLVLLLKIKRIVGCRWVFSIKHKAYGTIERYKIGGKRIYSNIWYRLPWDFLSSSQIDHVLSSTIFASYSGLAATPTWYEECISSRQSWGRNLHGHSTWIQHELCRKDSVQVAKGVIWTKTVTKSMVLAIYFSNEELWIQTVQLGSYLVPKT